MAPGVTVRSPARAAGRADAERPELVEREHVVGEAVEHVLDTVELGIAVGVRRLLPGLGALEGDAAAGEQTP
jgi:hypothetical protein